MMRAPRDPVHPSRKGGRPGVGSSLKARPGQGFFRTPDPLRRVGFSEIGGAVAVNLALAAVLAAGLANLPHEAPASVAPACFDASLHERIPLVGPSEKEEGDLSAGFGDGGDDGYPVVYDLSSGVPEYVYGETSSETWFDFEGVPERLFDGDDDWFALHLSNGKSIEQHPSYIHSTEGDPRDGTWELSFDVDVDTRLDCPIVLEAPTGERWLLSRPTDGPMDESDDGSDARCSSMDLSGDRPWHVATVSVRDGLVCGGLAGAGYLHIVDLPAEGDVRVHGADGSLSTGVGTATSWSDDDAPPAYVAATVWLPALAEPLVVFDESGRSWTLPSVRDNALDAPSNAPMSDPNAYCEERPGILGLNTVTVDLVDGTPVVDGTWMPGPGVVRVVHAAAFGDTVELRLGETTYGSSIDETCIATGTRGEAVFVLDAEDDPTRGVALAVGGSSWVLVPGV